MAEGRKKSPGRPFEPGKSGNPGGKHKDADGFREMCRLAVPAAFDALMASLKDPARRVIAAQVLFERAYGKPTQPISGPNEGPIRVIYSFEGDDGA